MGLVNFKTSKIGYAISTETIESKAGSFRIVLISLPFAYLHLAQVNTVSLERTGFNSGNLNGNITRHPISIPISTKTAKPWPNMLHRLAEKELPSIETVR